MNTKAHTDERFMRRALTLALRGKGHTRLNPLVGAVVVKRGTVIAEGYHAVYGGAHAEVVALTKAGSAARGATLYVTLESCSTFGKTPPCTDLIIRSGIKRVVIGAYDPNPCHTHRGVRILRRHGIAVTTGICAEEVLHQNEFFTVGIMHKRPFVILKMAQSLDGKIATRTGDARWISGTASRRFVHALRSSGDAVVVGTTTLRRDNPLITARTIPRPAKQPLRVILDTRGTLPLTRAVFCSKHPHQCLVVVSDRLGRKEREKYFRKRIPVIAVPLQRGKLSLSAVLT